jgi:hypothetical protein
LESRYNETFAAMARLKDASDPTSILNSGGNYAAKSHVILTYPRRFTFLAHSGLLFLKKRTLESLTFPDVATVVALFRESSYNPAGLKAVFLPKTGKSGGLKWLPVYVKSTPHSTCVR